MTATTTRTAPIIPQCTKSCPSLNFAQVRSIQQRCGVAATDFLCQHRALFKLRFGCLVVVALMERILLKGKIAVWIVPIMMDARQHLINRHRRHLAIDADHRWLIFLYALDIPFSQSAPVLVRIVPLQQLRAHVLTCVYAARFQARTPWLKVMNSTCDLIDTTARAFE